jgi:hypothetical protein
VDDSDMPTLSALHAFNTTRVRSREASWLVPAQERRPARRDERRGRTRSSARTRTQPLHKTHRRRTTSTHAAAKIYDTADKPARPPPIAGKIYEALSSYEEAPEESQVKETGLFGTIKNEILDTTYSTQESYEERKCIYIEAIRLQIKPGMEDYTEALAKYLALTDGDTPASFTHNHWHGLKIDPVHIEFLDTLPPQLYQRARPIAAHMMTRVRDHIKSVEEQGYLKYAMTGAYASPTMYTEKADGKLRMLNDLRKINMHIKKSGVPQPHIHAALQMLQGFSLFTELDWVTAYHQIPLDEEHMIGSP